MDKLDIVRAVNYCIMNLEDLKKEAIKQGTTIGELYIKLKENNNL